MKGTRLLVCVHIFYHEQTDYIIEKLKNINNCDFDLVVTYTSENSRTVAQFKQFYNETEFIKVENKGYDIYPFLFAIDKTDLQKYDYILKLHTKNHDEEGSYEWRNNLFDSILGTKLIFRKCLSRLKKYGIAGSADKIRSMYNNYPEDTMLFEEICSKIGIKANRADFVAGTIFLIRKEIVQKMKDLGLVHLDYDRNMVSWSAGTNAHTVERLFGVICKQMGYEIYHSKHVKMFSKQWKKRFINSIFSIKNRDTKTYYRILFFTVSFNRYNYNIKGKENKIIVVNEDKEAPLEHKEIDGLSIQINGSGNTVKIAGSAEFRNCKIIINSNINEVAIGENVKAENSAFYLLKGENKILSIGNNLRINNKNVTMDKANQKMEVI